MSNRDKQITVPILRRERATVYKRELLSAPKQQEYDIH